MNTDLYFAYGSNLNHADMKSWCHRHNQPELELELVSSAELPDHKLVFDAYSTSRNGGVLDICQSIGRCVDGVLFRVNPDQLAILDRKEGAPNFYVRRELTVIDPNGNLLTAITYQVRPERTVRFEAPSRAYIEVVEAGYRHYGISTAKLATAANNRPSSAEDAFFFYGTLMRDECRFIKAVKPFGISCSLLASTPGSLLDLGNYPGMLPATHDDEWASNTGLIEGDFVRLQKVSAALQLLDDIEGFQGYDSLRNDQLTALFYRTRVNVDVGDGRIRRAWTYLLASKADHFPEIQSGDWRAHRGTKATFQQKLIEQHTDGDERTVAEKLCSFLPFSMADDRQETIEDLLPLRQSLEKGVISERRLAQVSGKWNAAI
jgi:gamma-glutamylcyclotransferase (GGCT)/AIG2-like uncharacterized protein YtfP